MKFLGKLKGKILGDKRKQPTGGILVSFPKSGRTWLRVMLDRLNISLDYTHAGSAYTKGKHLREQSKGLIIKVFGVRRK